MLKLETFENSLAQASGKKHLMLGNGFSRSLFNDIFNYQRLAEKVNDTAIKKLFKKLGNTDFEYVMYKLNEALKVVSVYDKDGKLEKAIKADEEKLKTILIKVITDSHPASPAEILFNQYDSCYHFLQNFQEGRTYTFNYDLLLYWVYMHFLESDEKPLKCDDGFRTDSNDEFMVTWEIGREHQQTLYYLHGAMHIFKSADSVIEKFTWKNTDKTISQQVKDSIEADKFPVFISEGETSHKLKRIKENGYLARSFSSLKSIRGSLFIFGHSIRDEDDHVFSVMNNNYGLKKIFISLYGDSNSVENQVIIKKVEEWQKEFNRDYIFYDSESAKVWNRYDEL